MNYFDVSSPPLPRPWWLVGRMWREGRTRKRRRGRWPEEVGELVLLLLRPQGCDVEVVWRAPYIKKREGPGGSRSWLSSLLRINGICFHQKTIAYLSSNKILQREIKHKLLVSKQIDKTTSWSCHPWLLLMVVVVVWLLVGRVRWELVAAVVAVVLAQLC